MGQRQEYTFIGVSITTEPTQVFTWAALQSSPGPDEGSTIPTIFTNIPAVEITRVYGDAKFYVADGDNTTTQVTITSSGFNDPLPHKIDLKVISRETVGPALGAPGTAVAWPFYATVQDVKDKLVSIDKSFGTSGKLDDEVLTNMLSLSLGDINAAAATGGYDIPITNPDITTISAGQAVSTVPVALAITDITKLAIGGIAFIHGALSSAFNAEFLEIVNIDTTAKTATVLFIRLGYDSGVTIESCTPAFKMLRQCHAIATAMAALNSTTVGQSIGKNEKVTRLEGFLSKCLKGLEEGTLAITGLTKKSGAIKTFQTENPNEPDVKDGAVWSLDMVS